MSFASSLNGLYSWFCCRSAFNTSRCGCVSVWWIKFLTIFLRVVSCCSIVEQRHLNSKVGFGTIFHPRYQSPTCWFTIPLTTPNDAWLYRFFIWIVSSCFCPNVFQCDLWWWTNYTLDLAMLLPSSMESFLWCNTEAKFCGEWSRSTQPGLVEFQSLSLNTFQIAPIYCISVNTPIVFVHHDYGFIQIVLNFFQILIGVHRVHGCEEHGLPVPFETVSSRNQSILDDGVHVVSVPW